MIDYKVKDIISKDAEEVQDVLSLVRYIKPAEDVREVFKMRFVDVNNLKEFLGRNETIKAVMLVLDKPRSEVINMRVTTFFPILNNIVKQVEGILKAEERGLSSDVVDFKWEAVRGSERLAKYGYYNTLDDLSGGDITKWEEIRQLPYNEVFLKLLLNKDKAQLEREMSEIKTD